MTRTEAKAVIAALVTLRESATDEQALSVPALYPAWRSGVPCAAGQRVVFDGALYKVLQDHTSQDDWTPDAAPSLFSPGADPGRGDHSGVGTTGQHKRLFQRRPGSA